MWKAFLAPFFLLNLAMADTTASVPDAPASVSDVPASASDAPASALVASESASDRRVFNDLPLVAREYVFGVGGSVVAGALGFFIGSGLETAIYGNTDAHKGTLSFTGIRYDNFYGAFWGGAAGLVFGSALTTYFVGQVDEEEGSFFWTLAGASVAAGAGLYLAHLAGVNDEVDWVPFIPILTLPTVGGVVGFNVSRWFRDRKREAVMGAGASLHLHAPVVAWGRTDSGDRLEIQALRLTF